MIIMKFGGTSVEDAAALENVCGIVAQHAERPPFVVLSACAGVTNKLIEAVRTAAEGDSAGGSTILTGLRHRHLGISATLLRGGRRAVDARLNEEFDLLDRLAQSVAVLREVTPRTLDQFAASGERWSSLLLSYALIERGVQASWQDARQVMITDDHFTQAQPIIERVVGEATKLFLPLIQHGEIIITQGFSGCTTNGITTTIGRGGSDYSAAIFGAVLGAEEIQIWTDVDGFLTADPKLQPDARLINEMTFDEAAELAYFGAKVLHPSTILPAVRKNIPVRVLNSKRAGSTGTLITSQATPASGFALKSIAFKKGVTVVTIRSTRMLMAHGFLARVFEVFAHHQKSIDVVATSEVGVSLTVDNDSGLEEIVTELRTFADVAVDGGRAVLCAVGTNMKRTKGVAADIFQSLMDAGVNIELISHGGSEINLTFVVNEADIPLAVGALHQKFFS